MEKFDFLKAMQNFSAQHFSDYFNPQNVIIKPAQNQYWEKLNAVTVGNSYGTGGICSATN